MAYPPSYHTIKNRTKFRSGNWIWAPPGSRWNACDYCGTDCFCDAEDGLLPRTRKRRAPAVGDAAAPAGIDAAAPAVGDAAAPAVGDAAAPAVGDAAAPDTAPPAAPAAPVVVEAVEFEGILALNAYDE
jgi:hypothetical protein